MATALALSDSPPAAGAVAHEARGLLAGETVATRVDSAVAKRWLELGDELLAQPNVPEPERRALSRAAAEPLSAELGRRLTAELSVDAAAIYLVRRLAAEPANRRLRERFEVALAHLRSEIAGPTPHLVAPASAYVAFVPGFGWRSDRTTGADFARQRALLSRLGVANGLIETVEDGAIVANAERVATALIELASHHERIYLVSASKGGPEAALALRRLPADSVRRVEAWLSVGGLLGGSPYADRFARGVRGRFARLVFSLKGLAGDTIADLSTPVRRAAMVGFAVPEGVRSIAWIAVPLSGEVRGEVRGRWSVIAPLGPNDGLALVADQPLPGGRVLVAPGLDHYFRDPEIDLKTAALTAILFEES